MDILQVEYLENNNITNASHYGSGIDATSHISVIDKILKQFFGGLALVANLILFILFAIKKKKMASEILICFNAVLEILICAAVLIKTRLDEKLRSLPESLLCSAELFPYTFLTTMSFLLVITISVNRFVAVKKSWKYQTWFSTRIVVRWLVLMTTLVLIHSLPELLICYGVAGFLAKWYPDYWLLSRVSLVIVCWLSLLVVYKGISNYFAHSFLAPLYNPKILHSDHVALEPIAQEPGEEREKIEEPNTGCVVPNGRVAQVVQTAITLEATARNSICVERRLNTFPWLPSDHENVTCRKIDTVVEIPRGFSEEDASDDFLAISDDADLQQKSLGHLRRATSLQSAGSPVCYAEVNLEERGDLSKSPTDSDTVEAPKTCPVKRRQFFVSVSLGRDSSSIQSLHFHGMQGSSHGHPCNDATEWDDWPQRTSGNGVTADADMSNSDNVVDQDSAVVERSSAAGRAVGVKRALKRKKRKNQKHKITFSLFMVCLLYLAIVLPQLVLQVVNYFSSDSAVSPSVVYQIYTITETIYMLNFVINPVLYFYCSSYLCKKFTGLRNFFCSPFRIRTNSDHQRVTFRNYGC